MNNDSNLYNLVIEAQDGNGDDGVFTNLRVTDTTAPIQLKSAVIKN